MEHVKGPDIPMNKDETITRLVETYQMDLLRMSFVYLRDRALAEDAVQETFVKAYKSLDSFRGDSSEKTWPTRILINTCKDTLKTSWFRHLDRRMTPEDLPEPAAPQDGDEGALMDEILRLPAKYKDVILLYYYENMPEREIADALSIGVSTVSVRLSKARKKLRITLEGGPRHE